MEKIEFSLKAGEAFIPLIQLLKAANCVETGGEAQSVVMDGLVTRNGEVELRKRAKCIPGDVIRFDCYEIVIK